MFQKFLSVSVVKIFFFLLIFTPLLFSCNKFEGEQTIPSYIQIDKITLFVTPGSDDTLSSKITDAWVYLDEELIGAFELPAKIPILKKGKHNISIYPGIKMNGITGTRVIYEFYKKINITDSILVEGEVLKINSKDTKTYYKENLTIWEENFESSTLKFQKRGNSDTTILQTLNPANFFEGTPTGIVTIDPAHTFFEIETKGENFILPKSASPVFLEMNYKTNNTIYIGLLVYQSSQTIPSAQVSTIALKPTTEWKKIYINFTPDINDYYSASSFKVFIGAYKDEGVSTAEILFDNIKLVHFPVSK